MQVPTCAAYGVADPNHAVMGQGDLIIIRTNDDGVCVADDYYAATTGVTPTPDTQVGAPLCRALFG